MAWPQGGPAAGRRAGVSGICSRTYRRGADLAPERSGKAFRGTGPHPARRLRLPIRQAIGPGGGRVDSARVHAGPRARRGYGGVETGQPAPGEGGACALVAGTTSKTDRRAAGADRLGVLSDLAAGCRVVMVRRCGPRVRRRDGLVRHGFVACQTSVEQAIRQVWRNE